MSAGTCLIFKMANHDEPDYRSNIPRLNSKNYFAWRLRAKAELIQSNCWNAIEPGFGEPLNTDQERINRKALSFLYKNVSDTYLNDIAECLYANEAWTILADIHTKVSFLQGLRSLKSLFLISKADGEELHEYVARVQNQYQKVKSAGWNYSDKQIAGLILLGLPWDKYGSLVEELGKEANLSIRLVKARLLEEGNEDRDEGETQALAAQASALRGSGQRSRGRGGGRKHFQKTEPIEKAAPQLEKMTLSSKTENSFERKCYKCNEWGHIAKYCGKVRCFRCGNNGHWASDCKEEVQMKVSESSADKHRDSKLKHKVLVSACGLVSSKEEAMCWIVDSAATDHIANKRELFVNLTACQGEITMGKGVAEVKGCGTVEVKVTDECGGWTLTISDVLYVPDFNFNLLSVSKLAAKGVHVKMNGKEALCYDGNEVLFKAPMSNGLYVLYAKEATRRVVNIANNAGDSVEVRDGTALKSVSLWHQRLGHLNEASMKKIPALDIDQKMHETCEVCIRGKMTKIGFPKASERQSKQPLDLIHSDLMGKLPMSMGKARYILTFIDDYSRHLTVKFVGAKSDVFRTFKDYQREVEVLHGTKIKALQTDGGGEYCNTEFRAHLKDHGIVHRKTVANSPQQNGIAERANRTIANSVRCLLIESGLPKNFWAEAANTVAYVRNLCPSRAINFSIPMELWKGEKVKTAMFDFLKVFGCKAWMHVSGKDKFDCKGVECVFIGYDTNTKGYRLWCLEEKKVKIAHSVIFQEDMFPFRIPNKVRVDLKCNYDVLDVEGVDARGENETSLDITSGNEPLVRPGEESVCRIVPPSLSDSDSENIMSPESESRTESPRLSNLEYSISEDEDEPFYGWGEEPGPQLRRSARLQDKSREVSSCMYGCLTMSNKGCYHEPNSLEEAMNGEDADKWRLAMDEEMENLSCKDTYQIVDRPKEKNVLGVNGY